MHPSVPGRIGCTDPDGDEEASVTEWSVPWLSGPRLTLRPPEAGDAEALRRARDDAGIPRCAPAGDDRPAGGVVVVAVTRRDGGRPVGVAELVPAGGRPARTARLALWIAPEARRRGAGTEAATQLCSWAFRQGVGRVELLAAAADEPGQRLALAAGFRREGQLRSALEDGRARTDAVVFGRLATDPASRVPRALPDVGELTDGVVTLRPVRPGDEDALLDERVDREARRWATSTRLWTASDVRAFVAAAPALWLAGTEARFAIVEAAGGTCTGSLGLRLTVPAFGVAELGYGLRSAWRGRGLATRAVELVTEWAFTRAGIARVEIGAAAGNVASQRVAERAGFQREGVARLRLPTSDGGRTDEVRFGLLPPH
jgi:RimJ/RimL family protein N-acetyltransferase